MILKVENSIRRKTLYCVPRPVVTFRMFEQNTTDIFSVMFKLPKPKIMKIPIKCESDSRTKGSVPIFV